MVKRNNKNQLYLDEEGFLNGIDLIDNNHVYHEDVLNCAISINRYAYKILQQIEEKTLSTKDNIGIFFVNTLIKIYKDYQTIFILAERGLRNQSLTILRSLIEAIFIMQAVSNDSSYYNYWNNAYKKDLNEVKKELLKKDNNIKLRRRALKLRNYGESDTLSVHKWAVAANMKDHYDFYYKWFSKSVHYSQLFVNSSVESNDENVTAIYYSPDTELSEANIIIAMEYLVQAISIISNYLNLNCSQIYDYKEKIILFQKKYFPEID